MSDETGKRMILVVDDEVAIASLIKRILEREEFEVIITDTGRKAIRLFRQNMGKIDLFIIDISMPVMDGHDLLCKLKMLNPNVRVIFITGKNAEEEEGRAGKCENVCGFIQKPFRGADLLKDVRCALIKRVSCDTQK